MSDNIMKRPPITPGAVEDVFTDLKKCWQFARACHGDGCLVSGHEILGLLIEEFDEYRDEVRANDGHRQACELMDIAIAALLGLVSMRQATMDREVVRSAKESAHEA